MGVIDVGRRDWSFDIAYGRLDLSPPSQTATDSGDIGVAVSGVFRALCCLRSKGGKAESRVKRWVRRLGEKRKCKRR